MILNATPYPSIIRANSRHRITRRHTSNITCNAKSTKSQRLFNIYGEVVRETDSGNIDPAAIGDDVTSWHYYNLNTADYLVACKNRIVVRAGINNTAGPLVAQSYTYFDGNTLASTPPSRCEPTREVSYSTDTAYSNVFKTYDDWGNLATVKDPVGNVTSTAYDAAWHLFPETVTSPVTSLASKTEWDMVCGVPVKQAGFNGSLTQTPLTGDVTTTSHDALCRPVTTTSPGV
jgi:YD repeat-containing protein